ncbi:MAG: hypothetical protein GKR90_02490 [Pseudomonadales bacterium]|nr:hypothetical protein [Pseudomonadales bacterium]
MDIGRQQKAFERTIVGRIMTVGEYSYLITSVDSESGFATASNRINNKVRQVLFSIPEVLFWLTKATRARELEELEQMSE